MEASACVIEALLLRWGDSPTGRTVTFLLPEDEAQHPFKGLKTGPSNGQRLALSVALIADDETQHEVTKPAGKSFAQRAGILCNEVRFHVFLTERYPDLVFTAAAAFPDNAVKAAAIALRELCGVFSRKEILDGTPAGKRYLEIDAEYAGWLRHG